MNFISFFVFVTKNCSNLQKVYKTKNERMFEMECLKKLDSQK